MNKHNKNVKFSMEQLEQIDFIVNCYFGGLDGHYIHGHEDFRDWVQHQMDDILLSNLEEGENRINDMKRVYEDKTLISKSEPCSKCEGDPNKTAGGCRCEECGIIGNMPWGG